jgi:hypothetical protein
MTKLVDREIVEHAQAQERFLTDSEMQKISAFFQRVSASLVAAQKLRENSSGLVKSAANEVFRAFPHYAESCTNEERINCARDIEFCLRLITYGLVTNSTDQMDEIAKGLSEIFQVFKLEPQCLLVALEYIRSNHGLIDEEAQEADIYINHLSNIIRAFESESRISILEQLQEHFAAIAPGVSLADELIAERHEEARRELGL